MWDYLHVTSWANYYGWPIKKGKFSFYCLSWKVLNIPGAYFYMRPKLSFTLYMDYYIIIPNTLYRPMCCRGYRYCPMPSNYVIEQGLYTDVQCSEPGPFYSCGCRCSKLSNRTDSAHGCKMYCIGHFTALGGDTLVYSNYVTELSCTWMWTVMHGKRKTTLWWGWGWPMIIIIPCVLCS